MTPVSLFEDKKTANFSGFIYYVELKADLVKN